MSSSSLPTSSLPRSSAAASHHAAAQKRATGASTLGEMVIRSAARGDDVALRYPHGGRITEITYGELADRAGAIARGLIALGVELATASRSSVDHPREWTSV